MEEKDGPTTEEIGHLVYLIVLYPISLITMCCNSLIIYIIFRFSRVRTIQTILVANWLIVQLLEGIYTAVCLVLSIFKDSIPHLYQLQCTLTRLNIVLFSGVVLFTLAALVDWFLVTYFEKASLAFRKHYKVVILLIWTLVLLNIIWVAADCSEITLEIGLTTIITIMGCLISYSVMLLIVVLLQLIRAVQKCNNKPLKYPTFILALATGLTVMTFPAYLVPITSFLSGRVNYTLSGLAGSMRFSSGIITFILFYSLNKDFWICMLRVINRSIEGEEEND